MSETASTQLRRILQLIPRLADGAEHRIEDIASTIGTSRKQILSDFQSMCERFDGPGGFVDGVQILVEQQNVSVHANHFHRPMRLTMPELCALELGLVLLRPERTPPERQAVDRALERLRRTISMVPENDRHEGLQHAELRAAGKDPHLALIRQAIRDRRQLRLCYHAGGATGSAVRLLCPQCLVFAEQMWYVVATGEGEWYKFFRLDRIESVELLSDTFEPDATVVERVMTSARAFASDATQRMRVRYSPRIARWIAEREGAPVDSDGSLTLEHVVADDNWALRHVLQYGPEAEILSPPELRALLVERLHFASRPPTAPASPSPSSLNTSSAQ